MLCPQNISWTGTDNVQKILLTHVTQIMYKIFEDTDVDGTDSEVHVCGHR